MNEYVKLAIAAALPALAAVILYFLDKKTPFGKLHGAIKQIVFGLCFGALAIIGTEWGIPIDGAQVNCRDAAVLTAGLLFGGPAGIIAGIIGGVERWIAVAWGVGSFTRVACTVSTILAGFYAAALRRFMFESKKPGWTLAFAIGVVMEIFHMTMVFITNMSTPNEAMAVVRACTIPMVLANAAGVMLATMAIAVLSRESIGFKRESVRISQTIQRWLLITVVFAFLLTSVFIYDLQSAIANSQIDTLLDSALNEVSADIMDASDENLLTLTRTVAAADLSDPLAAVQTFNLSEINLIDENGIIQKSSDERFLGYDMHSGEQSAGFLDELIRTGECVQEYGPISYDQSILRKYAGVRLSNGGYLQVGYDAEHFQSDIASRMIQVTKNRHVGQTGYLIILDEELNVVSAPADFDEASLSSDETRVAPAEGETFQTTTNGVLYHCRYRAIEGYHLVAVYPDAEAHQIRNVVLYVNSFMEVLMFAVLFAFIYLIIKHVVVNRIKAINASLARITEGNLNEVVNVRSNEEFTSLSDDINSTVDTLKSYISEASARIDKELDFAKNIQLSALPSVFPAFPKRKDFDIHARMDTAREVGGDFYDFYLLRDRYLHFLIADVSGKGIGAALFMMRAKTELKSLAETDLPLDEVFTQANHALCEGNDANMFVTAWQGCLDLETGTLTYVNAGHNPPLIRQNGGKFEYLNGKRGFVLAGMDGMRYQAQTLKLAPGDELFLYTDGVTEAVDPLQHLYSEERLCETINFRPFETAKELCDFIKSDVDEFSGAAPQFDDITMLSLKYIGTAPCPEIRFDRASVEDLPRVTAFAEEQLERFGCSFKIQTQINVAIDEIYSNVCKFAYPNKDGPVSMKIEKLDDPAAVRITFTDAGIPYNPLTKEDPDVTLSAEERSIGGLGIFMVKKMMDDVQYQYRNDQNILILTKYLGGDPA